MYSSEPCHDGAAASILLVRPAFVTIAGPHEHSTPSSALQKVISTRTRMRDHTRQIPIAIKHHSISPRAASTIHLARAQDREFVPRSIDRESEALIVLVLMRIFVRALGLAFLVELVAFSLCGRDVGGGVAGRAAGLGTGVLAGEEVVTPAWAGRAGESEWDEREEEDGEELEPRYQKKPLWVRSGV